MASSRLQWDSHARAKKARVNLLRGKTTRPRQLFMEFLEQRLLLVQDVWTGGGDGKSWQDGSNWSLTEAPGNTDSAFINVGSSLTILYSGNSSVLSITDNAAIDITAGSLEVTSGTSQISGALTVGAGASLKASGSGATFTSTGNTTIDGASLYAASSASLVLPGATSYTGSNGATIQANGTGSFVDLSHLTTLSGATGYSTLNINAQAGAEVNLSNVVSQPSGEIYAHADGTNSLIDLSKLTELLSDSQYNSGFEASNGGKILAGDLTTLNRGDIHLDDHLSSITTSQITSITSSNLYAYGGGDLAFPALTQFSQPNGATIQANGAGSVLDLTSLTSRTGSTGYATLNFNAQAGGEVNLDNLLNATSGCLSSRTRRRAICSPAPTVLADPAVDGDLGPSVSQAEQYAFTLPSGADGIGNIEISVTANVDHTAYASASSLTNANLRNYTNGSDFPSAPTTLTVGGVDFALIADGTAPSSLDILQTTGSGTSFDIPVNVSGGMVLSTLINSTYGAAGDVVGTVEVKGTGGADALFQLVEGTNIRNYNNGGYSDTIAPGTPSASFGNGQVRLDLQTFVLPTHSPRPGSRISFSQAAAARPRATHSWPPPRFYVRRDRE